MPFQFAVLVLRSYEKGPVAPSPTSDGCAQAKPSSLSFRLTRLCIHGPGMVVLTFARQKFEDSPNECRPEDWVENLRIPLTSVGLRIELSGIEMHQIEEPVQSDYCTAKQMDRRSTLCLTTRGYKNINRQTPPRCCRRHGIRLFPISVFYRAFKWYFSYQWSAETRVFSAIVYLCLVTNWNKDHVFLHRPFPRNLRVGSVYSFHIYFGAYPALRVSFHLWHGMLRHDASQAGTDRSKWKCKLLDHLNFLK